MIERPHLGWWIAICGGLLLNGIVAFVPGAYDLWCRCVTAALPQRLVQAIFLGGVVTHVGEALYAARLARDAGLGDAARGWFWQTLALGFPSLRLLRERAAQ